VKLTVVSLHIQCVCGQPLSPTSEDVTANKLGGVHSS